MLSIATSPRRNLELLIFTIASHCISHSDLEVYVGSVVGNVFHSTASILFGASWPLGI